MTIDVMKLTGVNLWFTQMGNRRLKLSDFEDLSIKDIRILADLPKISSIRSYARSKDVSAASISKRLKVIEAKLNLEILDRSTVGVSITSKGKTVTNWARSLLKNSIENSELFNAPRENLKMELTIGTRGFLNISVSSAFIYALGETHTLKFIDLSPDDTFQLVRNKKLDITISFQSHKYGEDWQSTYVGKMEWVILKNHQYKTPHIIKLEDLKNYPLVQATYWDGTSVISGEDFLDVPKLYKSFGHGVQTAQTAISVALNSNQLIYVPKICAQKEIESGDLDIVKIQGHQDFFNDIYLHYNIDKLKNNEVKRVQEEISKFFD